MENVLVSDVMTRNPITISPDKDLLYATKLLVRKKIGSLPIVENKKLVGILTQKDILWALLKKPKEELKQIKVIEISPKKLAILKPTHSLSFAFEKMKKTKFEKMPVVANNILVGFLTARDILRYNPDIYPELEEFTKIKQEKEKLERIKKARERKSLYEGYCEECGNVDSLFKVNGMLICENCRNEM